MDFSIAGFPEQADEQADELLAPRMTVDDLLALSTPDLVKYIRQNILPDGTIDFSAVDGWIPSKLSPTKQERFCKKIQSAHRVIRAEDPNAAKAGPVDAGELASLLRKAQQDGENARSPRTRSVPSTPRWPAGYSYLGSPLQRSSDTTPPHQSKREDDLEHETAEHHKLVKEGGRPLFTLDRLHEIADNPEAYHSLLAPWAQDPDAPQPDDWRVFSVQLYDWRQFRTWQRDNRSSSFNNDEEFAIFRQEDISNTRISVCAKARGYYGSAEHEEDIKSRWESRERRRRYEQWRSNYEFVDGKAQSFSTYVDAARRRLKEHGFIQPFQFREDPNPQDMWTTWVEYIEYSCWSLDMDKKLLSERLQLQHDAEWEKVVEAGVLRQ